jgi:hypothetical protein
MRMSVLPPERHSVLLVHPTAVPTGLIALQTFEPIPRRSDKIVQSAGAIEQFQFTFYDAPQLARDPSSCACVSLAKQVGRCFVGERLNHT